MATKDFNIKMDFSKTHKLDSKHSLRVEKFNGREYVWLDYKHPKWDRIDSVKLYIEGTKITPSWSISENKNVANYIKKKRVKIIKLYRSTIK